MRGVPPVLPRRAGRRGADAATTSGRMPSRHSGRRRHEHGVLFVAAPAGVDGPGTGARQRLRAARVRLRGGRDGDAGDPDGAGTTSSPSRRSTAWSLTVRHHGTGTVLRIPRRHAVLAVDSPSFSIDIRRVPSARYDGDATDMPPLDDVVEMGVRYYGAAEPPVWPKAAGGEANCLYAADGSYQAALMPALAGAPGAGRAGRRRPHRWAVVWERRQPVRRRSAAGAPGPGQRCGSRPAMRRSGAARVRFSTPDSRGRRR